MALPKKHSCSPDRALEMRMLDVLDGLEELACMSSNSSIEKALPEGLEILSIEAPPEKDPVLNSSKATIYRLPVRNRQNDAVDIANWLIRQEQKT